MKRIVKRSLQQKTPSLILQVKSPLNFTWAKATPRVQKKAQRVKARKTNLEKVAFVTSPIDTQPDNLTLMGLKEKGKGNLTPKAKEKLSNMETEEKENPAPLQRVNLVHPHTHPSHVGFATRLATARTVVGDA
jgi:hypothetical protein